MPKVRRRKPKPKIRKRKRVSCRQDTTTSDKISASTRHVVQEMRLGAMAARRRDVSEFAAYAGRDAETGARIVQEDIHEKFHILADAYNRLIVMAHPESGKTTQLGILRPIHLLGNDHNLRITVLSKTKPNAMKVTRAIRSYIEKSEEVAEVFPTLIRGPKWEEDAFEVNREIVDKDPSVQAVGLDGTIIGTRIDVLIMDDVLDDENTRTPAVRAKTLKRIRSAFLDRMSARGVVIMLTNAWHPEDAAHLLAKEGWHIAKFPVIDDEGVNTWPAKWPHERLEQVREDLGPLEFARAFRCRARDEGESPFDEEAILKAVEMADSMELDLVYEIKPEELPDGCHLYTGVDLAVSKGPGSHLTSLVTIMLMPDLTRQLIWVDSGRWSSREIRDRVLEHDVRYLPTFIVENNAAQRWIIDIIMNQADIPDEAKRLPELVPFTTGRNKAHAKFGVEGLAVEFSANKWLWPETGIPTAVKEAKAAREAMVYYSRGAHTGDRLMALWFAREGARRGAGAGRPERETARDLDHNSGGVKIFGGNSEIHIGAG